MAISFDAVVIGVGHDGLAAAAHLSSRGGHVGVFERAATTGGAVKSAEVAHPRFLSVLGAMNLNLFAGSAFRAAHGEALARHGLAFCAARDCFASVFDDGTWLGASTDVETTAARIAALSEDNAATWWAMVADFP